MTLLHDGDGARDRLASPVAAASSARDRRPARRNPPALRSILGWVLRLSTVAALGVDAFVHLDLAPSFDSLKKTVSQGQLFRIEAVAAVVAGVLLLALANRLTWLVALAVLGGGLAAVLVYQYVDVGAVGPFPDMYDPIWTAEKTVSAVAEGAGTLTAAAGLLLVVRRRRDVIPRRPARR